MGIILNGKELAEKMQQEIKQEVIEFKEKTGKDVCLAVVVVGNNLASAVYVRNKKIACSNVNIISKNIELAETATEEEVLLAVKKLNKNKNVNGILVQLPLPKHINEQRVLNAIYPEKDADCFLKDNIGGLFLGESTYSPCTPQGILMLIKETGINISGKHAVVVGRSNIVGKPVAMMLLNENATVTICHSKTADLKAITSQADILVIAIGRAKMIKGDMIKPGAVVIDVGMNRQEDGKLCGDVDFDEAEKVAGYITPVPRGVGPMTVCCLMKNTLSLAKKQNNF